VVTHIRESRRFESMYTMQGKTGPTRHVRFPHQSTYVHRTLPADGFRTWQPFIQSLTDLNRSTAPKKKGSRHNPQHAQPSDPRVRTQLLSHNNQWSSGKKSSFYWQSTTRLTGPISLTCDRYVQYLLMGTNPSVLNRHRRGLPHRKPRNSHSNLPALPFRGFHWSP
jgi:hypothetical protein